ncbi:LAFA_0G14752g1_1 [Lachancea sp. 'fantastica']|nr:LAFA_0G14752g1_1 [Lachancea sp. 'fantastica']
MAVSQVKITHKWLYQLSLWAVRTPLLAILVPFVVTFIVAYPTLTKVPQYKSFTDHHLSRIELATDVTGISPNYSMAQVWISRGNEGNILRKGALMETLALQNKLLGDVFDTGKVECVESPFQLWNNSLELLSRDPYPLRTLNSRIDEIPHNSLRSALKVNGYFTSAQTAVVNILTPINNRIILRNLLNENVAKLSKLSNSTGYHFLRPAADNANDKFENLLKVDVQSAKGQDFFWGIVIFSFCAVQFWKHYNRVSMVNSRSGVCAALAAQIVLCVAASNTLTIFFFGPGESTIPFSLMWFPISIVSSSGLLERLSNTAGSAVTDDLLLTGAGADSDSDNVSASSYIDASVQSSLSLCRNVILSLLSSIFLFPFNKRTSFFLTFAFLSCLVLQAITFTAILSSDYNRQEKPKRLYENASAKVDDASLDDDRIPISDSSLKTYLCAVLRGNSTIYSHSVVVVMLSQYLTNLRYFLVRSSSSLIGHLLHGRLRNLTSLKSASSLSLLEGDSIIQLISAHHRTGTYYISWSADDRVLALKNTLPAFESNGQGLLGAFQMPLVSSYKFDLYFFFEITVIVGLVSSVALLVVQTLFDKLQAWPKLKERNRKKTEADCITESSSRLNRYNNPSFHAKELSRGGHTLDIVCIYTSESPFIVSVGLDRRLLVWSPLSNPAPLPTEIPLNRQLWPVVRVVTSSNGNFTAVFGKSGRISCWSRKSFSYIWSIKLDLANMHILESFFRAKTIPAFMRRQASSNLKHEAKQDVDPSALKRRGSTVSISSAKSTTSATPAFVSKYEDTASLPKTGECESIELVIVTTDGNVQAVDFEGNIRCNKVTNSTFPLVSCKRLITPRVNDRLIICDTQGDIYISTVVNNRWKPRKLVLVRNSFNRGQKLMTPATLMNHANQEQEQKMAESSSSTNDTLSTLLIPFVGMLLLVKTNEADLVDAQTGTVIKTFELVNYMPGSLRIFHDQPTHCKFCGSASVSTLSIAYTERYTSTLVLSTFRLESRTKTSICLRVERDPREIRCLGLESVVEKKYWLADVDKWDSTDNNVIIGLRKREKSFATASGSKSMMRSASEDTKAGELRLRGRLESRSMKPSKSVEYNIHDIWEGWTMTAQGQVTYYKIPAGVNGLLTNRIGSFEKFGAKAVVAAFGNVMKLFYLGHEEFIMAPDGNSANEEESGLKFVNRRRQRLSEKKVSINYGQY